MGAGSRRGSPRGGCRRRLRRGRAVRQSLARAAVPWSPRTFRTDRAVAGADLSDLKPVYLIYGSEELLLERAEKRLRDRLAAVADLDFNLETFDGAQASADDIVNAANTMPFMSERRLVIVRDVDKMDAASLEQLAAYARDPAPFTCLVLAATKIAKNTKLYRAVAETGVAFEYAAPKRNEYASEVVRLLKERGKAIRLPAAQRLVDIVGRDLRRLDSEADKLAAFVDAAGEVTETDVVAVASESGDPSVFELTDAVGDRDTARALRLLRRLLASETPYGVHAMLARHMRALVSARALSHRGMAPEAMAPEIGMPPWQVRTVVRQAERYEPSELSAALRGLAAAEEEMKTSPTDAGLVIERWVIETAGAVTKR
jgi:DNA polymerase-3 subunit delta